MRNLLRTIFQSARNLQRKSGDSLISHRVVRDRLIEAILPALRNSGFDRVENGKIWRQHDAWVDVVQIVFVRASYGKAWSTTRQSPSLAIGRYLKFAPPNIGINVSTSNDKSLWPNETQCHIRKIIYASQDTNVEADNIPANVWYVGSEGEHLEYCLADARRAVDVQIVPWFDWLINLETILHLILKHGADVEGKGKDILQRGTWGFEGSFGDQVLVGLLACKLEKWALCTDCFAPVLERRGVLARNGRVYPLPAEALELIESAYKVASTKYEH